MLRTLMITAGMALCVTVVLSAPPALAASCRDDGPSARRLPPGYEKAVKAVRTKDYRRAIALLTEALKFDARHADSLNYMGYSHRQLGDLPNALRFYRRALVVEPDHRGANEYLGEAYLMLDDLPKAEARLAHLFDVCGLGCEEYTELDAAIKAYKARRRPGQSSRLPRG